MNGADNLYSRFVYWSKILLPLAALALLSTLFLFAKGRGGDGDLPYAEIEAIAQDNLLAGPNFAGVTDEGAQFSISAEVARPDPDGSQAFLIDQIKADLVTTDGLSVEISAGQGRINPGTRVAELSALARLSTSNGYDMETTGLIADFNAGQITSTGPLEVHAPFGSLTAGGVSIMQGKNGAGSQIIFNAGVRLVYQPKP